MCCVFTFLILLGPRAALIVWWLIQPFRFGATFPNIFLPIVGIVFLPWTTIAYLIVFPFGLEDINWIWVGLGLIIDIASYAGGGYGNRSRFSR